MSEIAIKVLLPTDETSSKMVEVSVPKRIVMKIDALKDMYSDFADMMDDDSLPSMEAIELQPKTAPEEKITEPVFKNVMEYCDHYANPGESEYTEEEPDNKQYKPRMKELQDWDKDFFNKFSIQDVLYMSVAADFLGMERLYEVSCEFVALKVEGKNEVELRKMFGVENDFTEEELKKIKEENIFCEEKHD